MMINYITSRVDETISAYCKGKWDVKRYLINHYKKPLLLNNLAREINKLENAPLRMDKQRLDMLIDDFTKMFIKAALISKEQELMSSAEQDRVSREQQSIVDYQKELDRSVDESPAGVEQFNPKTV